MKQKQKIINSLFLTCFLIIEIFGFGILSAAAATADCAAGVSFGVNPASITSTQSATIMGSVTATNLIPYGFSNTAQCYYPGTTIAVSQYLVSIFDLNSSQEVFYLAFPLNSTGVSSQTWTLPSRQIGANELKQSSLTSATSLNLVAVVKVTDGKNNWATLTQSSPVSVAVSLPAQNNTTNNAKLVNSKACNDSSECQSNFCETTSGVCEACTSDSMCNTSGDNGFTCNSSGVCVAASTGNPAAAMSANSSSTLYNPLPNQNNLTDLLITIMKGFLGIVAAWAVAFIVIGGFRMVISQGNEEAVTVAKKTIVWAILGLLVAVLSFAIIAIVQNIIGVTVQTPPASYINVNKNES